jgi:hypothetical protein
MYSVDGNPLSETEYKKHLAKVLPGDEDKKILVPILNAGNWMSAGAP